MIIFSSSERGTLDILENVTICALIEEELNVNERFWVRKELFWGCYIFYFFESKVTLYCYSKFPSLPGPCWTLYPLDPLSAQWNPGGKNKKNIYFFSPSCLSSIRPWIENPAFPAPFFFFSNKKNAVNWTVKPGQKRLNLARIGYIHIKRYFRAMYLHKWVRE